MPQDLKVSDAITQVSLNTISSVDQLQESLEFGIVSLNNTALPAEESVLPLLPNVESSFSKVQPTFIPWEEIIPILQTPLLFSFLF